MELPASNAAAGAPDELHARLAALARLVARDAARLRGEGLPPWSSAVATTRTVQLPSAGTERVRIAHDAACGS